MDPEKVVDHGNKDYDPAVNAHFVNQNLVENNLTQSESDHDKITVVQQAVDDVSGFRAWQAVDS